MKLYKVKYYNHISINDYTLKQAKERVEYLNETFKGCNAHIIEKVGNIMSKKDDLKAQELFIDYVFSKSKQERKKIKTKLLYYVWQKHNKEVKSMNDLIWRFQHGNPDLFIEIEVKDDNGLWLGNKKCLEHFYL